MRRTRGFIRGISRQGFERGVPVERADGRNFNTEGGNAKSLKFHCLFDIFEEPGSRRGEHM